jgi:GxxExxY protein
VKKITTKGTNEHEKNGKKYEKGSCLSFVLLVCLVVKKIRRKMIHDNLLYKEEVYKIQGAIYNVYHEIGTGFLESVYQECLFIEFSNQHIPFIEQKLLTLQYKNNILKQQFKADFVCYDKIIVEIKAVKTLDEVHRAQLINYLKVTGLRLGLLVNFHTYPKVTVERFIL